jgi:hypothetical protein
VDRGYADFREHLRLLKKSLSARSAVLKRHETRPKHYKSGVFTPEPEAEECAKEFFNTLTSSRHLGVGPGLRGLPRICLLLGTSVNGE